MPIILCFHLSRTELCSSAGIFPEQDIPQVFCGTQNSASAEFFCFMPKIKIFTTLFICATLFAFFINLQTRPISQTQFNSLDSANDTFQKKSKAETPVKPLTINKDVDTNPENPIGKTYGTLEIEGRKYEEEINEKTSVYEFMYQLRTEKKIEFEEKNYTGLGVFIESIDGIKSSGGYSWIYYINNQKAMVGVSNYQLKNGDIISWKYEKEIY